MKKSLLLAICLIVGLGLFAQSVPQGIPFQAVARDLKGQPIPNKEIDIRISLLENADYTDVLFQEFHKVNSNELGLFDLVIGTGRATISEFNAVPWSQKEVWIEIAIRENNTQDYQILSNSQLLSVPYALHAGSAGTVINSSEPEETSLTGPFWKTTGNNGSLPQFHFIGNVDAKDLNFRTANQNRLTVQANGDIEIDKSLEIGENLDVGIDANIGRDLFVGRNADIDNDLNVDGDTDIYGYLKVNNGSPTDLSGTLNVDGRTDLNNVLEVDGATDLNNSLSVNNAASTNLSGILNVDGRTDLNDVLEVDGITNLNSALNVNGLTIMSNGLSVSGTGGLGPNGQHMAFFENRIGNNLDGIAVKINKTNTDSDNNFMTFYKGNSLVAGRIEGFDLPKDLLDASSFPINDWTDLIDLATVFDFNIGSLPGLTVDFLEGEFNFNPGSLPSLDLFENIGFSVGGNDKLGELICWAIDNDLQNLITTNPFDIAIAAATIAGTQACKDGGVTFGSKGADYAEYLERLYPEEKVMIGNIVGVHDGKVSKRTEGADQVMVITNQPIVLGNIPEPGKEDLYEKVSFMGQVPVLVKGQTNTGDYILPSGRNDGYGIAVDPDEISLEQLPMIVGRAWSSSDQDYMSVINVAIGLNRNDMVHIIQKQKEEIEAMKSMQSSMETSINSLLERVQKLEVDKAAKLVKKN